MLQSPSAANASGCAASVRAQHPPARPAAEPALCAAWLDRKQRELALLDRCLAQPLALPRATTLREIIEHKLRIAAALRAERSLASWAITETARPETSRWRTGAFRFAFGYQRADLEVRGPAVYPLLDERRESLAVETLYTTSGMSAIAALLSGLLAARGHVSLVDVPGGYGETRELLARLGGSVASSSARQAARDATRPGAGVHMLWIDSALRQGIASQLRAAPAELDLIACDTTCWAQTSGWVRRVVDLAHARGVPAVLLRSHAKLDCIGIEYGRLGSVVIVRAREARSSVAHAVVREVRASIRLLGSAAIPAHFPPFTGTDDYRALSAARTATIIRNVRQLARRLAGTPLRDGVAVYAHGLYLTVAPRGELRIQDVKRAVDAMCRALSREGLPVRHAGSFGFDFTALEWFTDPLTQQNVVRVAPGDLPGDVIDRIADALAAWFARQDAAGMARRIGARVRAQRGGP